MVQFEVLNITDIQKFLLNIDVRVKEDSYYENVYISEILIDDQDTFIEGGPSLNAKSVYTSNGEESKRVVLHLGKEDGLLKLSSSVYFVYVITEGNPSPDTPCGMDNNPTLGITYYEQYILRNYLTYIKEINNSGNIPKNFINFYLKAKAFELSLETGHYTQAITYWNKFFKNKPLVTLPNNCNCNGS
jgi:hypothetical protein